MPFYEYQCAACQHHLEVLQKISDPPLKKCPSCGRQKLKKLISPPVFRLKGSGWYETDFKSDKEAKRNLVAEAEKESKDADAKDTAKDAKDGKDAKTTETKPAAPESPKTVAPAASAVKKPASTAAKAKSRPKPVARKKAARR